MNREVKFKLDEKGKPLEVMFKERKEAHRMIEEFMLLANREVANFIFDKGKKKQQEGGLPFVFRVHNDPIQRNLMISQNLPVGWDINFQLKEGSLRT